MTLLRYIYVPDNVVESPPLVVVVRKLSLSLSLFFKQSQINQFPLRPLLLLQTPTFSLLPLNHPLPLVYMYVIMRVWRSG